MAVAAVDLQRSGLRRSTSAFRVSGLEQAAPAIAMIAAFVLAFFGVRLAMRSDTRNKGVLMVVMALVLVGNVVIWTL